MPRPPPSLGRSASAAADDVIRQKRYIARILAPSSAAAIPPGHPDATPSADERRLQESYIDSCRDAVRQALRLAPDKVLDVFMEPDLDILRRRGALEAVARELGKSKDADAAKQ